MKKPNQGWLVLAIAVSMLGVPSCSDDDDAFDVPVDQAVEAGLDEALQTTVVPLVTFFGAIGDLFSATSANAVAGFACPDTSEWCSSGTVTCTPTAGGLAFDWNQCQVVTGDAPLMLDGNVTAIPNPPTVSLALTNLVINGSPAISGPGLINTSSCTYQINVDTPDSSVSGTVVKCDSDPYPTGTALNITFDPFSIDILFNSSVTAPATASQDGYPVAYCSINLDTFTSTCDVP